MKDNMPKKIHIIGSVGSGKTTLARALSHKLNIPYYELDNVVWKRNLSGDIRRSDEERDEYLNAIVVSDRWIIEGAHNHDWVLKSLQSAELIVLLDTPYWKRVMRIIKRYILQKWGVEKANYTPTFKIFVKMFEWNHGFEKQSKPNIIRMLHQDNRRFLILRDNNELDEHFT